MSMHYPLWTEKFCDCNPDCRPDHCDRCPTAELIFEDMEREHEEEEDG